MKYYKIVSIYPETDRMKRLVSDTVFIEHLRINSPALLVYVDENLEPSYNKMMKTSRVQEVDKGDGIILITTINNTYTLKELVI